MSQQSGLPELFTDSATAEQKGPLNALDTLLRADPFLAVDVLDGLVEDPRRSDFDENGAAVAQTVAGVLTVTDGGRRLMGFYDDATTDTILDDPRFPGLRRGQREAQERGGDPVTAALKISLLGLAVYAKRLVVSQQADERTRANGS